MPCRCEYEYNYEESYHNSNKKVSELQEKLDRLRKDANNLKMIADQTTQLLCYVCGIIRKNPDIFNTLDQRLIYWIKNNAMI